jgi:methylated-DNA-[protein]-cysteine S-methyltransferase
VIHRFPTPLGACELAWEGAHVTAVRLLGEDAEPSPPPGAPRFVREAVASLQRHLDGEPQDLRAIPLALGALPPFHRRVYELAREIGPGRTVTYGELASRAGSPGASRAVGQAMAKNPFILVVPCHRVLAGSGRIGGF